MPTDPPIACSLGASELPVRLDQMAALGRDALLGASGGGRHAELRFRAAADVRDRVDAIAEAESACCAFLGMRVAEEGEAIALTIDAPEGAELVLEELVAAFLH